MSPGAPLGTGGVTGDVALRMDDVGAASKRHEVYGLTRLSLGPVALPFPGNLLFLKYVPPIKRWGPYRELGPADWEALLALIEGARARLTVAVTAGWVERNARVTPYPVKCPEAARVLRHGVERGLVEVANHGYTHCVLDGGRFRPRWWSGNRSDHREFHDWLPEATHREHLCRAQDILQSWIGAAVQTLVPPGNVFSDRTLAAAAEAGLRYLSCRTGGEGAARHGLVLVDPDRVLDFHDRDVVLRGPAVIPALMASRPGRRFVTVREIGRRAAMGASARQP